MRNLFAFNVLVLCIFTCNLHAQNLVVGSVPPGMLSQSLNMSISNPATYIDLDCDGNVDFSCFHECNVVMNAQLAKPASCTDYLTLIDSGLFVFTNNAFSTIAYFSPGDTLYDVNAKTNNVNQADFTVSSFVNNGYVCFYKIRPDSSKAFYWIKIYVDESMEIFQLLDVLKPVNLNITPIHKNVCTGSYYTFPNNDLLTVTTDTIQSSHVLTAGLCDSQILTYLHVFPVQQIFTQNISVCKGGHYTFPDGYSRFQIDSDFTYHSSMISNTGCDSLIITNVNCLPAIITFDTTAACKGSMYTFADGYTIHNLQNEVQHDCHLSTIGGCDSIVKMNLMVNLPISAYHTIYLCKGSNYTFPDLTTLSNIQTDTIYVSWLLQANGCDSFVYTNIRMLNATALVAQQKVCYLADLTLADGQVISGLTHDTVFDVVLKFQAGCDSVFYHYDIQVDTPHYATTDILVCKHADYTFPDGYILHDILESTNHISILKTAQNCDSLLTTQVMVLSLDTAVSQDLLTLSANDSNQNYQWLDCNNGHIVPGENDRHFKGEAGKSYQLIVSGHDGCTDTSSCHTLYTITYGVDNEVIHIYPNPSGNLIHIELYETMHNIHIRLLSTSGQIVNELQPASRRFAQMNVSALPKGVYFIQITGDEINRFFKVMVQ